MTASLQLRLLDGGDPSIDSAFFRIERLDLGRGAWLDYLPRWVQGSDGLFADLEKGVSWQRHQMMMYDRLVDQPRLSASLTPEEWSRWPMLSEIAAALSDRYREPFSTCWLNLYRDGRDGVAWHGDRTGRRELEALVAIVSLGEARRFLLRPKGGGESRRFDLGRGDLLVMGGTCQRTFEHSVPKTKHAGPRISVTFRPGPGVY
ncbi:MAG TPA: alpha-ketoglutarate-dependent dioxygenase AlkB [Vicinamibacteria bacterium]|nr:alpha-ketoglutarate-dependent dioxygenase AlkB [Vicinamibacteria bacterium]